VRAFGDGATVEIKPGKGKSQGFFGGSSSELLLYNLWNSRKSGVRLQRVDIPTAV